MQDIERDALDRALGSKLREYEVRPPEGLLERIERTMAENGGAAVRPQGFITPAGEAAGAARHTLPQGRRRRWLYRLSAVGMAALLALALLFTFRQGGDMTDSGRMTALMEDACSEAEGIIRSAARPEAPPVEDTRISDMLAGIFGRIGLQETQSGGTASVEAVGSGTYERVLLSPLASGGPLGTGLVPVGRQEVILPNAKDTEPEWKAARRLWDAVMAEEERRTAYRGRPSASIYAGNLGGGSHGGRTAGSEEMVIHENSLVVTNPMIIERAPGSSEPPAPDPGEPTLRHNFPVSAGVVFDFPLGRRLSLQTGLNYSFLRSVSENYQTFGYRKIQALHYLGIPLSVAYTPLQTRYFSLYLRGGFMLEKAVYARAEKEYISPENDGSGRSSEKMNVKGVQPSVDVSVGGLLSFSPTVGLYAEPGLAYYFGQSGQPSNYRTRHPLSFSLRLGLRFTFGQEKTYRRKP